MSDSWSYLKHDVYVKSICHIDNMFDLFTEKILNMKFSKVSGLD